MTDEEYIEKSLAYADRDCKGALLTVYKTKSYASSVAYDIAMRYKNGDEVRFQSRQVLQTILASQSVTERTFESVCAMQGLKIRCDERCVRNKEIEMRTRRSKYQYILDGLDCKAYYYSVYNPAEAQFVKDYNRKHKGSPIRYLSVGKRIQKNTAA